MKIAVVSFHFPPIDIIGSGMQMHMIANEYVKLGHSVTVFSANNAHPADALYAFKSAKITGANKLFQWFAFVLGYNWSEYDFIHAGGDGHLFNKSAKVVLRTLLGSSLQESRNQIDWRATCRMRYLYCLEQFGVSQADVVTSISPETNADFTRRIEVVPCGIDLSTFGVGGEKSIEPSILFVGVVNSRKRGNLLIDKFINEVLVKQPTSKLNIVRETKSVAHGNVVVHGVVSTSDLVKHYQSNWVMVLPSSYEGFGLPYVEAMACGTPVIATSNPGSRFVLEDGRYGVITSDDKLGESVCEMLDNCRLRKDYIDAGLERAQHFNIRTVANRYLALVR